MAQVIQLASAFGGARGFACVFNIRGKKAFLAAVGGAIGWGGAFYWYRICLGPVTISVVLQLPSC